MSMAEAPADPSTGGKLNLFLRHPWIPGGVSMAPNAFLGPDSNRTLRLPQGSQLASGTLPRSFMSFYLIDEVTKACDRPQALNCHFERGLCFDKKI